MPPARRSGARGRAGDSAASARRGRRKRAPESGEEGGSERWLVTYADVLTLLLVLFIVLFSISVVNTSKFISLKTSLSAAFGNGQKSVLNGGNGLKDNDAEGKGQQLVMPGVPVVGASGSATKKSVTVPGAGNGNTKPRYSAAVEKEVRDFTAIKRAIKKALVQRGIGEAVRFSIDRRGLIITIVTNSLVFPGNSADLLPGGREIIATITPPLRTIPNRIEVDGYTNQVNVSTYPYPSGWELSSARASAVVRFLITDGVAENRLSAVGWSDQHPLYPPSDPRAITLNRRVEVVVRSSLPDSDAAQLPAAAAAEN
jgi:chemotaxis protein MotB